MGCEEEAAEARIHHKCNGIKRAAEGDDMCSAEWGRCWEAMGREMECERSREYGAYVFVLGMLKEPGVIEALREGCRKRH